jgi:methionyl-tRNA formyltransferase
MVDRLRLVFFGTPQFAVPTFASLLASRHVVCGVVTQPDRPSGRGQRVSASPVKALALERGIPIAQPQRLRDLDFLETFRAWQPDLGVVAAYGKLIPENLLAVPRLGMINVHASLLPKYRGAAPIQRAIIDGEIETGVTIMRMVKELDAGRMLAKVSRAIGPDETADAVERDLAELGAPLLVSVVDRLAEGEDIPGDIQDYMITSYAPRLTRDEGLLDWTLPAVFIHNRVRGLHPWPHAHTYLDGNRLIVLRTVLEAARTDLAPGTVVDASDDAIHVATGHGGQVAIIQLQPEGRRPMAAKDYLAGHPLRPGARLTGP